MKDWKEYSWKDITPDPIPQTEGHLAQISYSPKFLEVMGYFRVIQALHEVSERAIALTTAVIEMNPAHYSAWDYRYELVKSIGNRVFDYKEVGLVPNSTVPPFIGEDGVWLNQFTLSHSKNYQVWNYRQLIADPTNELWYKGEKVILDMVFEDESKNFHAWSYYKWIIQLSQKELPGVYDGHALLADTEKLLDSDVLNNSVWSFRYFIFNTFESLRDESSEIKFISEKISVRPSNESAWSYLHGYVNDFGSAESINDAKELANIYSQSEPRAVELLAEFSSANEARELWHCLGNMEPTRKQYWDSRA